MSGDDDAVQQWPLRWRLLAVAAFIVLATLNSGGYRYGVGDQAFYLPAIQRHLQPDSFPRDRIVIDDQDRLNVFTRVAAAVVGAGVAQPALFAAVYLGALALLAWAVLALAQALGLSAWAQLAVLAALTLKHRVGLTGVNTLEGYAHPRMLAFAIGVGAIALALRARPAAAMAAVAAAFVVHPTTALWFGVWLGVTLIVTDRRLRRWLVALAAGGVVLSAWVVGWGPLSPQLVRMDAAWLGVLSTKDYLFATGWPADMWAVAAVYVAAVIGVAAVRRSQKTARPGEAGLVAGLVALVALFIVTLPLIAARLALAVQFQVSRVLWMFDLTATLYVVWLLADWRRPAPGAPARPTRRAAIVAAVFVLGACVRGGYVTWVEHPERALVQYDLPASDWQDTMAWLRTTPVDVHVLADPGHAWRQGTSVRVAAGRDVLMEEVKDAAMAMYSRRVAVRVAERTSAIGDFSALTPAAALSLASRFDLDYLVTPRALDLPVAYRNAGFTIYRLKQK